MSQMEKQDKKSYNYSFCLPSYLYNNFQTSKEKTLIFDMRNNQDFHKHHIKGAINLSNHRINDYLGQNLLPSELSTLKISDLSELLDIDEAKRFTKRKRCFCFFIISEADLPRDMLYELKRQSTADEHEDFFQIQEELLHNVLQMYLEHFEEKESVFNAVDLFRTLQKDKMREIYIVLEGASNFFIRYPFMANHTQSDAIATVIRRSFLSSYEGSLPHDILDSRIFLGSFQHSEKYDLIKDLKITHILNITSECDNIHEDKGIKYLKISILDESDKGIHTYFKEAYEFIHEALSGDENKILIHCAMGKSRSATITIMFLMKKFSWDFEKAFAFVKRKRDIVCPNEGFVQRLQEFEKNKLTFEGYIKEN